MKLPAWKRFEVFNMGEGDSVVHVEATCPEHALLVAVTGTSSYECSVTVDEIGLTWCGDYCIQTLQKGVAI